MGRVAFISHASEDAAIAATITDYLEKNGVSCWIAPRDLTPGREYSSEIVDGIESSAVFVLVLSENANESIFVKREVERAVSKGKPVFPIRVREVIRRGRWSCSSPRRTGSTPGSRPWRSTWTAGAIDLGRGRGLSGQRAGIGPHPADDRSVLVCGKTKASPSRDRCRPCPPAPDQRWLVCLRLARPFRPGRIARGAGEP
jgi:TIR domain